MLARSAADAQATSAMADVHRHPQIGIIRQHQALPEGFKMPTKNVVLTDRQFEFVDKLVAAGRYQNASEVLRDGLRLVERRDNDEQARLRALREAARVGIADVDEGRFLHFDTAPLLRQHLADVAKLAMAGAGPGQGKRRR